MITQYTLQKVYFFKAVLPIMIISHHLSFFYGYPPYFEKLGSPLVVCFFMMSGYGLMTSWQRKGRSYLKGFLKRSLLKLFVPYVLALLAYIPIALATTQKNLVTYFVETDFIDWLCYSWFVWVLMGGYLFFYLIFRIKAPDKTKILFFFIVTLIYYMTALNLLDGRLSWVFRTSYAIVFGMLWKYKEEIIIKFLKNKLRYLFLTIFSLVGFVVTMETNNLLFYPLFAAIVFVLFVHSINISKESRLIKFLSDISYEMYLWQGIWIVILCEWLKIPKISLALLFCLILDIAVSSVAHYLSKKILCLSLARPRV